MAILAVNDDRDILEELEPVSMQNGSCRSTLFLSKILWVWDLKY